ncbi:GLPGLI family protein [Gynurincola endophyticus]|uniref:GLPGLI family protein n=1 Tax=Gynurincola endophyticus TaxID=2479004 RepID=UPI000F8E43E9|nr:GLPGLI family protein [Gynurincola endophyticus]
MKYLIITLFIFSSLITTAQVTNVYREGRIIYERKVNTFATMPIYLKETKAIAESDIFGFMEKYRTSSPQFWTDTFALNFEANLSIYQPVNSDITFSQYFAIPAGYKNVIVTNFSNFQQLSEKEIFDQTVYVSDSLKQIKWKFTDEIREIAGYECKRANGIMMDSIYVVAFYTTELMPRGGPESFNGLPGMILGVALPHLHISYFATSVELGIKNDFVEAKKKYANFNKTVITRLQLKTKTATLLNSLRQQSDWIQNFIEL